MTREQLKQLCQEILAADKAATPGPWKWSSSSTAIDRSGSFVNEIYPSKNLLFILAKRIQKEQVPYAEILQSKHDFSLITLFRAAAPELARAVLEILKEEKKE